MNMMRNEPRQTFFVHRWTDPATSSDFPFLAVPADRSALLSLGNYNVSLDFGLPEEAAQFLAHDFAPTGEELYLDLRTLRRRRHSWAPMKIATRPQRPAMSKVMGRPAVPPRSGARKTGSKQRSCPVVRGEGQPNAHAVGRELTI